MGPIRPLSSASSASVRCTMDEMRSVARSVWARMRRKLVARASIVAGPRVRGRARRRCGRGDREVVDTDFSRTRSTKRRSSLGYSKLLGGVEGLRSRGTTWSRRRRATDPSRVVSRVCVPRAMAAPPSTVASDGSLESGASSRRTTTSLALESPLARASFRVVTPVAIRAGSTTRSSDDARANETFARSSVRVASPASECARLPPRTPSRDSQLG